MTITITDIDRRTGKGFIGAQKGDIVCVSGHRLLTATDLALNNDGELIQKFKYLGEDYTGGDDLK